MPEMTVLGWFHTILGIGAVLTGFYAIAKFKIISLENKIGQIYVVKTLFFLSLSKPKAK